jgi:hypothetical protein
MRVHLLLQTIAVPQASVEGDGGGMRGGPAKLRTAVAISKFAAHPARDVTLVRTDAAFHAE